MYASRVVVKLQQMPTSYLISIPYGLSLLTLNNENHDNANILIPKRSFLLLCKNINNDTCTCVGLYAIECMLAPLEVRLPVFSVI